MTIILLEIWLASFVMTASWDKEFRELLLFWRLPLDIGFYIVWMIFIFKGVQPKKFFGPGNSCIMMILLGVDVGMTVLSNIVPKYSCLSSDSFNTETLWNE